MRPKLGLALRIAGPALELICLVILKRPGADTARVAGLPLVQFLYAGLAIGLIMVVAGLALSRRRDT